MVNDHLGNELEFLVSDSKLFWKKFKKEYTLIHAAGGIVYRPKYKDFLAINRMGYFDLPKGKVEKKEKKKKAAIREIEEETGVNDLEFVKKLIPTYHTYTCKYTNREILKKCHWYWFHSEFTDTLTPQEEEDIQECFWFPIKKVEEFKEKTYGSISLLLQEEID